MTKKEAINKIMELHENKLKEAYALEADAEALKREVAEGLEKAKAFNPNSDEYIALMTVLKTLGEIADEKYNDAFRASAVAHAYFEAADIVWDVA